MRGSLISAPYLHYLVKNKSKIKIVNVIMTDHHHNKEENNKFLHAHRITLDQSTLNLIDITATPVPVPRKLPTQKTFEKFIQENQYDHLTPIVFFDEHIHFAARAWYTFRYFGFKRVYVLDGGFNKWHHQHDTDKHESKVFEDLNLQDQPKDQVTSLTTKDVQVISYLKQHKDTKGDDWLLLDARDPPRYKKGSIPGSYNLPYTEYLNDDHTMKSTENLQKLYKSHQIDITKKIVNTCQTGKLSCIALLAQEILKKKELLLFDGSYEEWNHEHPIKQ
ncbi:unnamed protein product [Paramecium pentaurelia]|uniref:Rhodanese domain-containing protein n=1 Tax=Paramecium pentaurelia TaxID=43138 RepID=A0A8S1SVC3_9CILI|nr:unnamed protein product [Paramecium pentaurelia]